MPAGLFFRQNILQPYAHSSNVQAMYIDPYNNCNYKNRRKHFAFTSESFAGGRGEAKPYSKKSYTSGYYSVHWEQEFIVSICVGTNGKETL